MSTLSVPLQPNQEQFIDKFVKEHKASNKADVVRRALRLLEEEDAIADILLAQKEATDGKILEGDPRELLKKF